MIPQFDADVEARRYAARTADLGSATHEDPYERPPRTANWCACGHWVGVHQNGHCENKATPCECAGFRPDRSIT